MAVVDLQAASQLYHQAVGQVGEYLKARGITGEDALYARLGFVEDPWQGHEPYAGRLAIPYTTADGVVRDIRFRRIGEGDSPKYLSLPGSSPRLYEARCLASGPAVVAVCEGELDALVARRVLGVPAVGIPGASAWKGHSHWRALLSGPDQLLVLADGDDAGRQLASSIARDLPDTTSVVVMPDGMDVSDVVNEHGEDALRVRVFGRSA